MEIDIRGGPQLRGLPLQELLFDITVALYYNNIKEANKFFKINPE